MPAPTPTPRLLVTAGPTHEPIDEVRYIANRSSGRLGTALAECAARREDPWNVTLLLGPTDRSVSGSRIALRRFRTTQDLQRLLDEEFPRCDALIMAAAVADYRPADTNTPKLPRSGPISLRLEPTPDLLAACASNKRPGQLLIGFALEPRTSLEAAARAKLQRKQVDLIVANPLETMDSDRIEAAVYLAPALNLPSPRRTPGPIPKPDFAPWLLDLIDECRRAAPPPQPRSAP